MMVDGVTPRPRQRAVAPSLPRPRRGTRSARSVQQEGVSANRPDSPVGVSDSAGGALMATGAAGRTRTGQAARRLGSDRVVLRLMTQPITLSSIGLDEVL
jgi:hypothetical protein